MRPAPFDYHAPGTLQEAVALLARYREDASILAGGQSLVPAMAARLSRPSHIIDLNRTRDGRSPKLVAGRLCIPPLMRHCDFAINANASTSAPGALGRLLAALSEHIGSRSVRTRGTFCGAIANADPASEWCLAAVVLGAEVSAHSHRRGVRHIPAERFFATTLATALEDDELITEVQIPLLAAGVRYGFHKIGPSAADFGAATALALVGRDGPVLSDVRIGVGAVVETPQRAALAEALLERRRPSARLCRLAADAAATQLLSQGENEAAAHRADLARAAVLRALEEAIL